MDTLLAIGRDPMWLQRVTDSASMAGFEIASSTSVCDALTVLALGSPCPRLVVVDADCCTERTEPALRALRARLRVPFLIAFGPASERMARALPSDALVAKPFEPESIRRLLSVACGGGRG